MADIGRQRCSRVANGRRSLQFRRHISPSPAVTEGPDASPWNDGGRHRFEVRCCPSDFGLCRRGRWLADAGRQDLFDRDRANAQVFQGQRLLRDDIVPLHQFHLVAGRRWFGVQCRHGGQHVPHEEGDRDRERSTMGRRARRGARSANTWPTRLALERLRSVRAREC